MTDDRTSTELAHAWRAALLGRDAPAFADLFAPDGVLHDVEHRTPDLSAARPIVGRPAIEAITEAWLAATPAFRFEIAAVLARGDAAAYRWTYEVTGAPGTAVEGITWLTCAGGRIRHALVVFDSLGLLRGLGRLGEVGDTPRPAR